VGRFIYGTDATNGVDIDDRTLAHLRLVIMNKLRRNEPFMFDADMSDASGRRSYWIGANVAVQFHFFGSRNAQINRSWVEDLIAEASSPNGLRILPEPTQRVPQPIQV
jgi:hypothetical protein